jgi:hypothetical protein
LKATLNGLDPQSAGAIFVEGAKRDERGPGPTKRQVLAHDCGDRNGIDDSPPSLTEGHGRRALYRVCQHLIEVPFAYKFYQHLNLTHSISVDVSVGSIHPKGRGHQDDEECPKNSASKTSLSPRDTRTGNEEHEGGWTADHRGGSEDA